MIAIDPSDIYNIFGTKTYKIGSISRQCVHKFESRYNQNPSIQSRALKELIESYENFHAYATHSENTTEVFLKTIHNRSQIQNTYVFAFFDAGLGNRLLSLISSFIFSLMTNRILIISFHLYDVSHLLCEPFQNSSWQLPQSLSIQSIRKVADLSTKDQFGNAKLLDLSEPTDMRDYICQHNKSLPQPQIIYIKSCLSYSPLFHGNPTWSQRMKNYFPDSNYATVIAKYLLHPVDKIWKNILDSYHKKNFDNTINLGFQIRFFNHTFEKDGFMKAFSCLWNRIHAIEYNNQSKFIQPPPTYRVYVASLYPQVKRHINYLTNQLGYSHRILVQQKYAGLKQRYTVSHLEEALHDIWLLSLCDDVVISERSTLGYIIMVLRNASLLYFISPYTEYFNTMNQMKLILSNNQSLQYQPFQSRRTNWLSIFNLNSFDRDIDLQAIPAHPVCYRSRSIAPCFHVENIPIEGLCKMYNPLIPSGLNDLFSNEYKVKPTNRSQLVTVKQQTVNMQSNIIQCEDYKGIKVLVT